MFSYAYFKNEQNNKTTLIRKEEKFSTSVSLKPSLIIILSVISVEFLFKLKTGRSASVLQTTGNIDICKRDKETTKYQL